MYVPLSSPVVSALLPSADPFTFAVRVPESPLYANVVIGPAVAVPEVIRLTLSPALIVAPPVLSVNPEASFGEVPVLETLLRVLALNPSGAEIPSS